MDTVNYQTIEQYAQSDRVRALIFQYKRKSEIEQTARIISIVKYRQANFSIEIPLYEVANPLFYREEIVKRCPLGFIDALAPPKIDPTDVAISQVRELRQNNKIPIAFWDYDNPHRIGLIAV